jgi:hypothetical protein
VTIVKIRLRKFRQVTTKLQTTRNVSVKRQIKNSGYIFSPQPEWLFSTMLRSFVMDHGVVGIAGEDGFHVMRIAGGDIPFNDSRQFYRHNLPYGHGKVVWFMVFIKLAFKSMIFE